MKNREWLVSLREKAGLTQQQVAQLADVSRSYYAELETGAKDPSVSMAKSIAHAMSFDWTIFFNTCCREKHQNSSGSSIEEVPS